MCDEQGSKGASDRRRKQDSRPFNRVLVDRATLQPDGGIRLFWGGCDCGTPRAARKFEKHTPGEQLALRCTGLTGEVKDGFPCIRAIVLKWRFSCHRFHMHHQDFAVFLCPFGPEPACVLQHGWGPDDPGFRGPHCRGPLRPEGDYRIVAEDPGLPGRMIGLVWGCPLDRQRRERRLLLGRGNDVPARS